MKIDHDYGWTISELNINGKKYSYCDLKKLNDERVNFLPFSIRVLLESVIRNCNGIQIKKNDVENIINWRNTQHKNVEVLFCPSRVVLQDFSSIPALIDFASIRGAVDRLGGDPSKVNPITPADLIIDYPVQAEYFQSTDSHKKNQEMEFERNRELFQFLKWSSKAFQNLRIIPPGSGFVHQVNMEYLAKVVFSNNEMLYPDSLVGADSHSMMINGLGILGWVVGGIEAESVMLGKAVAMTIPKVVGYKISGVLNPYVTSTDIVVAITKHLRQAGVAGKFVEFFGSGVVSLSIADRATIANMCPEYGAQVGFFPADNVALLYLRQSGHTEEEIKYIESYLKANNMFRDYNNEEQDPIFTEILEMDLANVIPTFSGPKRLNDRVEVKELNNDFKRCLNEKIGLKGFGVPLNRHNTSASFMYNNNQFTIKHGSIVISSISSCTNTSCPSVILGAGLLAKNAVNAGLSLKPYIKASINPGSAVVSCYLQESGVEKYLKSLGFDIKAFGVNEKFEPLPKEVSSAIKSGELVTCGLLSGNRNFEARVHPLVSANYLGSPLLVIAYTIAGTIDINFEKEPIGHNKDGEPIYLNQIWPTREEIQETELKCIIPSLFHQVYLSVNNENNAWNKLKTADSLFFPWDSRSTYIRNVPFFDQLTLEVPIIKSIENASVLLKFGDVVTTDHISPAGMIARNCPAAKYLASYGLSSKQFNSYGSRRGNVEVMARGTFGNIRIFNKIIGKVGPRTKHWPSGDEMDIYEAAERYKRENKDLVVLAGKDYGCGSSRDWAAKGPWMQGIKAVIAESFDPTHKSNLIGMGIAPLEFLDGQSSETLGLTGKENFNIEITEEVKPNSIVNVKLDNGRTFQVKSRFDSDLDILYYRHGGILNYFVRKLCKDFKFSL
ncbi:cytoplasmic aconitate hydratase isoform X2 [Hydra vulgaris]|uniref:Cytoplasmic aconitate hydratase isoform X2 n=1 Tax=Hydra vulgaris TaxID=6087 RepID=A0ABM4CZC8_HYDVU